MSSVDLFFIERRKRDFVGPTYVISKIVKPIRNRFAFHFVHELLTKLLKRHKFQDDRLFAIGRISTKHDCCSPASDDLMLNFIISRMPSDIAEAERHQAS